MLAKGAGAEIVGTLTARRDRPDAKFFIGSGKADEAWAWPRPCWPTSCCSTSPVAGPAAQPGTAVQPARGRPGRVDPGYLRAARQEPRRQAAGRAGPAAASGHAPDAHVEPPGASARRHWHARSRRIAAGNGPPHDRRQSQRCCASAWTRSSASVTQRRARARGGALSVSLVGYTNAGKSTLFNALTRADSYAADQLFATLDTTTRRIWIEGAGSVVVSDTVGFIRDLPHGLIARSAPRWRKPCTRTCCCTRWTRPVPSAMSRYSK